MADLGAKLAYLGPPCGDLGAHLGRPWGQLGVTWATLQRSWDHLGVDIENLIISQPDHGEQALEITDNLIRSGAIDMVIIDSVAALTPKS